MNRGIMKPSLCAYGMRLRGFSPGCQPMSGLVGCMYPEDKKIFQSAERYHDVLLYSRQLTAEECRDYELLAMADIFGKPLLL